MIRKTFVINGVQRTMMVNENETLATFLRERLLLTGCKIGCGEGHCGACNVIVDGKVARSCLMKLSKIKDGAEIIGNRTKCKVVKNKVAPPFKTAEFDILYGEGVSKMGEIVDTAVEFDIIKKSGSWFSYDDMKIGQGRDKVKQYLIENPSVCDEVEKKIRELFAKNTAADEAAAEDVKEEKKAPAKAAADDDDYAEFSPEDLE